MGLSNTIHKVSNLIFILNSDSYKYNNMVRTSLGQNEKDSS